MARRKQQPPGVQGTFYPDPNQYYPDQNYYQQPPQQQPPQSNPLTDPATYLMLFCAPLLLKILFTFLQQEVLPIFNIFI